MGKIAEDINKGLICDSCGYYFKNPNVNKEDTEDFDVIKYEHGTPTTCWDCWSEMSVYDRKFHTRAKVETI